MRYFLDQNTLFIRGWFRAAGTGIPDGIATVSTLIIHTVPDEPGQSPGSAEKALELAAAGAGIGRGYAGLVTTVPVQNLCVLQYDFLTVFITAGNTRTPGTTTIALVICSTLGMSDAALHEVIRLAGTAKTAALAADGWAAAGSPADSVIVACEPTEAQPDADPATLVGPRLHAALLRGIPEAIRRSGTRQVQKRPAFFIFSRFKGEHWVEWIPEDCPYYPCHFPGQRCDFCYCPLYPCGDEALGQWAESSNGGKVWNCARCTMIHEPGVAGYLKHHPEATKDELVRVWRARKKTGLPDDPGPVSDGGGTGTPGR